MTPPVIRQILQLPSGLCQTFPRLEDYFGVWAIQEQAGLGLLGIVESLNLTAHMESHSRLLASGEVRQDKTRLAMPVRNYKVGQIDIVGQLMKHRSSLSLSTSTVMVRQMLRRMANDAEIDGILLFMETPGGTVAGTYELAMEIRAAKAKKPVGVYVEDLCASAGVWLSSQADFIMVNKPVIYGSIGTFMVVYDFSAMAEKDGVKVHVLKRGEYKAIGVPGTQLTEKQLAHLDTLVGNFDLTFKKGVSEGRGLSVDVLNSLEAKTFGADEAMSQKLVDAVGTYEESLVHLGDLIESRRTQTRKAGASSRSRLMNFDDRATIADLKKVCPGASSDFIVEQVEKEATIGQAMQTWMETQQKEKEAAVAAAEKAAADAAKQSTTKSSSGVAPGKITEKSGLAKQDEESPSDFDALVRACIVHEKVDRRTAILRVAKRNPEAHKEFVLGQRGNDRKLLQSKIEDRFEQAAKMAKQPLR